MTTIQFTEQNADNFGQNKVSAYLKVERKPAMVVTFHRDLLNNPKLLTKYLQKKFALLLNLCDN